MEKETYEQYKARKGIVFEYQATNELALDVIKITVRAFKKASELKNKTTAN